MTELTLPRLAGSRSAARSLVRQADGPLEGGIVIVDCRELRSAPPSFADELVKAILVEGCAASLTLRDASEEFIRYVRESAASRKVPAGKVDVVTALGQSGIAAS
ncbi:hypothetical protein [Aeromicrobium sp. Root472D3]|uniref:hypothetical protein n=1 Tax=Aeromicrobium sp. Root472D3 TaxID=1736540 RepID=UPI0006FAC818|nr:hypothetical protein [Aeromicrobium sp. Root472D3]KQX74488.1 hypothetical protein ASD10_04430 [Aeromicrobium sp. Root472D3]